MSVYFNGGISPLETFSTSSPASGWASVPFGEVENAAALVDVMFEPARKTGATFEYQRHLVRLLWQS